MTEDPIVYEGVVVTRRMGHPLSVDTAPRHAKMNLELLFEARAYLQVFDGDHLAIANQVEYAVTGYDPADCTLTLELVKDHRPAGQGAAPDPDPLPPYIDVKEYRTDDGRSAWVFRCWGDGECDGALHLDLGSQSYAERKAREHVAKAHPEPTS